jgi:cytokinesis protein
LSFTVSVEEISSGARDLHTGLQKIRRDLESRFLDINDGYSKRMFPFSATAEGRVDALRDQVQAGIRAFNEVKMYYGEGDEKYNAATNPLALGRPGSLEFFGVFKTFLTSYDVSLLHSDVAGRLRRADIFSTAMPIAKQGSRRCQSRS